MTGPQPRPGIMQIKPYQGGQACAGAFKLSSNENPLGCSPVAKMAVEKAAGNLAFYPDGEARALREAIAEKHGLKVDQIICGAGSDEIFQILARAWLEPGDNIVQSEHAFLAYRLVAWQSGAQVRSAPEKNMVMDMDAVLDRVNARTKIVFLANPNNPTGAFVPQSQIARLHAGLPESTLLVLDGAYAEYVRRDDYDCGLDLAMRAPNVLITRTFSKIYGLAALRLGWAFGALPLIDALNRVRGPFNVNAPAQAAGVAAIGDSAFQVMSAEHNETERDRLATALGAAGLTVYPSAGNFVLIRFGDQLGRTSRDADAFLRARRIIIRDMNAYGLPDCLRASIGTRTQNDAMIAAFSAFVQQGNDRA